MPDDLLRFVVGPTPAPWGWAALAGGLVLLLISWYAFVFIATRSLSTPLPRVVERARDALLRRRFAGRVRKIGEEFAAGTLGAAAASAALSRTVRDFLHQMTGARAQYLQVSEIAAGELAAAAPLLAGLNDVQFNVASGEDVAQLSGAAEELILSWT